MAEQTTHQVTDVLGLLSCLAGISASGSVPDSPTSDAKGHEENTRSGMAQRHKRAGDTGNTGSDTGLQDIVGRSQH